jgi:hypothetical protein
MHECILLDRYERLREIATDIFRVVKYGEKITPKHWYLFVTPSHLMDGNKILLILFSAGDSFYL